MVGQDQAMGQNGLYPLSRHSRSYTDKMLADWANWLKDQTKSARAIYAYFNNDAETHAIDDARRLHEAVVKQGC